MCILLLLMALDLVFSDTSTVYRWRLTVGLARMKKIALRVGGEGLSARYLRREHKQYLASFCLRITIFQQNLLTGEGESRGN